MRKTVKKVGEHFRKHHAKLKHLDHKILEFLHGVELSFVLLFAIAGTSFAFVYYITGDTDYSTSKSETSRLEQLLNSEVGQDFKLFMNKEEGKELFDLVCSSYIDIQGEKSGLREVQGEKSGLREVQGEKSGLREVQGENQNTF